MTSLKRSFSSALDECTQFLMKRTKKPDGDFIKKTVYPRQFGLRDKGTLFLKLKISKLCKETGESDYFGLNLFKQEEKWKIRLFDYYPEYYIKLNEDEIKLLIGKLQRFETDLFSWSEVTSDGNMLINDFNKKRFQIEKCLTKEEKHYGELQYIFNIKYFIIPLLKATLEKIIYIINSLAEDINMEDIMKESIRIYLLKYSKRINKAYMKHDGTPVSEIFGMHVSIDYRVFEHQYAMTKIWFTPHLKSEFAQFFKQFGKFFGVEII